MAHHIFICMNNFALKLIREKGSISLKVHDLIKMPEDDFSNLKKQSLYESGKYYHRAQKGILRVSKYEFYSTKEYRNVPLKKHDMEIIRTTDDFDYAESGDNKKIWYMNFSDKEIFNDRDTKSYSLNDIQIMEMPLLYKVNRFLNTDHYACLTPTTFYKDGNYTFPTPILLENVPQWYEIKNTIEIEKNKPVTKDKYNNIICMVAPSGVRDVYTEGHLYYLCASLFAGFGGIVSQGIKSKIHDIELHTGNWGCGNLGNNPELMYLSQMAVASVMGFSKIYFHKASEIPFNDAKRKFESLLKEFSYEELVGYLFMQKYCKYR